MTSLHDAYREAMEALRQGDGMESGAQFISDLSPAVKGGELLCKKAMEALNQHYMDANLSLVSLSGMLTVSPITFLPASKNMLAKPSSTS